MISIDLVIFVHQQHIVYRMKRQTRVFLTLPLKVITKKLKQDFIRYRFCVKMK